MKKNNKTIILIILVIIIFIGSFLYFNKTIKVETVPSEKLFIENYIRENINNIATNKAVLGGKWYITNVLVNPSSHTADISYEDGHIESKANIIYNYQKSTNDVEITKFEVIK